MIVDVENTEIIQLTEQPITVTTDGWKSISNTNLIGYTILFENIVLVDGEELKGKKGHNVAVQMEEFIKRFQKRNGKLINCNVTDQASPNVVAKEILALRHTHVFFLPCFEHQVNLIVEKIISVI